jgi:hypothetical protein
MAKPPRAGKPRPEGGETTHRESIGNCHTPKLSTVLELF